MLRRLAFFVAALVGLSPIHAFALGLGNIEMQSTLNQPLDARIELLRARQDEVKDLTVNLASVETFKKAGIDRPAFLSQLRFEVVSNPEGTPYIKVFSTQAITEPFLNFLIEVNWPNGRLLREFTMLVDPPVLTERGSGAVDAPRVQDSSVVEEPSVVAIPEGVPAGVIEIPIPEERPVPVESSAAAERPAAKPRTTPPRAASKETAQAPKPKKSAAKERAPELDEASKVAGREGGLEYGPVKPNDTLWEIALKVRPDKSMTVPQLMLALLENNPEAFIGNNINNLKQGAVLRLGDVGAALKLDKDEAMRIADLQWEQWQQARGAMVGSTPSNSGKKVARRAPEGARVKLMAPEPDATEGDSSGSPKAVAAGSANVGKLRRELSLAQEAMDASKRENQEARDRVSALEDQVATMQRLIMLKDDKLATMQGKFGAPGADKAGKKKPEKTPEAVAAIEPTPEDVAAGKAAVDGEIEEAAAMPEQTSASLWKDPKVLGMLVAVIGAIGVIVWLVIRRRNMQNYQESILTDQSSMTEGGGSHPKGGGGEDAPFMSDFAVSSMEGIQTDINEVDPLSEADVYLAYGRYKQAEELISQAIEKDPARADLKMKLMEVHYAAKDKEAFELQAEMSKDGLARKHPEMWARVLEMGRELSPNNTLFGGHGSANAAAAREDLKFAGGGMSGGSSNQGADDLDLGLDFDLSGNADKESDNALDFDLGDIDLTSTQGKKDKSGASSENSLDFDLNAFDQNNSIKNKKGHSAAAAAPKTDEHMLDFSFDMPEVNAGEAQPAMLLDEADANATDNTFDFDLDAMKSEEPKPVPKAKPGKPVPIKRDNVVDFSVSAASSRAAVREGALVDQDMEADLDDTLFADVDEIGTKLDLAKAYIDMGDSEGARSILDEVLEEGNDHQKQEAKALMRQIA